MKKMNLKRGMAIALTVAMAVSLNACGKKKSNSAYTEDGRMIITMSNTVAISDNSPVEKYLEEKYNVEIKAYGYATNYYDKIATMIAAKEVPDVMFINDMSQWQPLAKQGALATISLKTVEKGAPDHYKHINETDDKMWKLGEMNGNQYAIPKSMGEEYNTVMLWNNDMLKEAGITEVPKTIAEYDVAFEKLKEKGYYGLSGVGGNYYRQFDWLFGAYGVMPEMWTLEDGNVINGTVSAKAKEALAKLNEWYQKGYIHPEFLTDDQSSIFKRYLSGQIASVNTSLGNVSKNTINGQNNLAGYGEAVANRIVYEALPEGPNGESGDWLWGPVSNYVVFGAQLQGDTEKQEIILNILNDLNYDEETALVGAFGFKGEHYEFNDETAGKESGIKPLGTYGSDANQKAEAGIGYFNFLKCGDWATSEIANQYTNQDYVEEMKKYASLGAFRDLNMRVQTASSSKYAAALQTLKIQAYSEFINGTRNLDSDWDAFVNEYNTNGGEILREEAQEFYDNIMK